jgi:hypothetical protein
MGFLTSHSSSNNVNNPLMVQTYTPQMQEGTAAAGELSRMLSGTQTAADTSAYNNYLAQAGYQPAMQQMARGVTGNAAAAGLLNSGSTSTALQAQGAQLNNQFYNNYLSGLSNMSGLGTTAGGIVASTGQQSQQSQGLLDAIGSAASGIGNLASGWGKIATKFGMQG